MPFGGKKKKGGSVHRDNGMILNLVQYSQAILLPCIISLHLPFHIPSLLFSHTGLSILMLILHKKQQRGEEEQAPRGKQQGRKSFLKGMASG